MKLSRQRVLDYFRTQQIATASEVAQTLDITKANARHHIRILVQQGLLMPSGLRAANGKGRPSRLYLPTEASLSNNFAPLCSLLLEMIPKSQAKKDKFIRSLAERLAEELYSVHPKELHLSQRLVQAVRALNTWQYQARWEAHADAPRIIFGHCPYATIVESHPELCDMDRYLLSKITNREPVQLHKLELDNRGLRYCMFNLE